MQRLIITLFSTTLTLTSLPQSFSINEKNLNCKQNSNNDSGVSKIETKWYYFGSYMDVYLSNNLTNQLKKVFEEKNGMEAVFFLADAMGNLGFWAYQTLLSLPANTFGLASNLAMRKPWQVNGGNGIQWGQGVFGTITNVWGQA